MNIKQTIITAAVALTMVAMIAPMTAGASTAMTGSIPTACVSVTFTRNLRVGSVGQDVQCFQALLNTHGYVLGTSGAGSPGHETTYFGPKTLASVKSWQAAQGWTPANQVGPLSRALFNSWLSGSTVGTPTTPTTPTTPSGLPAGCTSTSGFSPITGQACTTGVVVQQTGPVTATLASDTPGQGAIIGGTTAGQAGADLLHILFTGSGTVTSVTLQRSGISDQNTLANVYLYDGNTRITDGYSFNVNSQIVINGLNIAVSGSHEISVRADVSSLAYQNSSTIIVGLTGFSANGTASNASVMGNMQTIVVGNLAAAILSANTATGGNVNAGTTGYSFWTAPIQINTRAVWLKTASFKMIGSAPSDALSNIRLFIDGVDTGKTGVVMAINGSNYAVFDLTSNPISLATGSHTIDMRGDVQKGTNRNITVSLAQASDLTITDPQIGVNVALLGPGGAAFSANSAPQVTILTGSATVIIDPTFNAMTNVSSGATNAVIARFIVHAYGEDVKISTLQVNPYVTGATAGSCTTDATTGQQTSSSSTTCGLENVTLYFNGSQVGTQKNFTQNATSPVTENSTTAANELSSYSLGSQMVAPAGQDSTLEVRADLQTTGSVAYTVGTVKVTLPYYATATTVNYLNGQGQDSQNTTSVPSSAITTSGLTISSATLVVSKNTAYLNQNISPNTTGVRIGSFVVQNQSTSEAVRLTSLNVLTLVDSSNPPTTSTDITDLSALRTSDTTSSGSNPIQPTGNDNFSVSDVLQPGASMTIDVFANTSTNSSDYVLTKLTVASIGVVDNISNAGTVQTGQTLSLGNGSVATPTIVTASTTPSEYVAAGNNGATNGSQATFKFISTNGASTITELKVTVSGSDATASQTVNSVCVGSQCAPLNTVLGVNVADLTGLSLAVPNGAGGLVQPIQISYSKVGTGGVNPATGSTVSLTYVKYTSGGTTATLSPNVAANQITLVGSVPTVTVAAGGSGGMILGASNKVGQVTVTADSHGAIQVQKITFSIGYSGFTGSPTSTSAQFIALGGTSTKITGSSCVASSNGTVETCTLGSGYSSDFYIGAGQSQQFDLYITNDTGTLGTTIANISSTPTAAGFVWDDTSANGTNGYGVAITGSLINGFPTNAYSIHQ